jgi:hypothetical protein
MVQNYPKKISWGLTYDGKEYDKNQFLFCNRSNPKAIVNDMVQTIDKPESLKEIKNQGSSQSS